MSRLETAEVSRDGGHLKTTPPSSSEANFDLTGTQEYRLLPKDDFHVRGVSMAEVGAARSRPEDVHDYAHEHAHDRANDRANAHSSAHAPLERPCPRRA